MLSRAFTKPRKSFRYGEDSCRSASIHEYDDCIIGFMEDQPLILCGAHDDNGGGDDDIGGGGSHLTLREVLRASVGVVGESSMGMTEKMVLISGKVCAIKRFRRLIVRRGEFGRRIERLAQVSRGCEYLVQVTSYLYTKRIKFVVSDYYPMGSLADLLSGTRDFGHTKLQWKQRLRIILHIAKAIAFIHSQSPHQDKLLQINVHGNIKSSNVMINVDFGARLSDYGFVQLAEPVEVSDTCYRKHPTAESLLCGTLSQKSDIHNFGVIILDILVGAAKAAELKRNPVVKKEEFVNGKKEIFEFHCEGKGRRQALKVLDIGLACTNRSPEARPSIEQIFLYLGEVIKNIKSIA
ncbi:hypothetical protein LguiA_034396 [Lonicera macranthoides]